MPSFFRRSILILALLSPVPLFAETASGVVASSVTLRQCFEWARAQSEDLRIRREDIEQSQARGRGAISGALPQLDWKLTDTYQDPAGVRKLEGQGFGGFVEKNQMESRFTATQALFSGLREYSAEKGFRHETVRNQLQLERANRDLFQQTAEAFYSVIGYETDRANTRMAYDLAESQVKELGGFLKLGKARESEVFTARAHAAALKGQLDALDGQVASAREDLSYLTGRNLADVPLGDEDTLPIAPSLDDALNRAHERSDLRAQREEVEARRIRIRYERGYYWPTADLTGNYYTRRATFLKDIDWDVVLDVDVPISHGGETAAAVREALSAYRQAGFVLQQMERQVTTAVRKTHGELSAALKEAQSMDAAAASARQSYDSLRKEYRLGLVTNLDVLQALDFLRTQQNARDTARLNAKRLFIQLGVATEQLP